MNWFNRHINWTWWIGRILVLITSFYFLYPINFVAIFLWPLGWIAIDSWYLHRKQRSYLWLLLTLWVGIFTLLISNKSAEAMKKTSYKIWELNEQIKIISSNYDAKGLRDVLSCPTCVFFNGHEQLWCNSPESPDVQGNVCYTFKAK